MGENGGKKMETENLRDGYDIYDEEYMSHMRETFSLDGEVAQAVLLDIRKHSRHLSLEGLLSYNFYSLLGGEAVIPYWAFFKLAKRVVADKIRADGNVFRRDLSLLGRQRLVHQEVDALKSNHPSLQYQDGHESIKPGSNEEGENINNACSSSVFAGILLVSRDWRVGVSRDISLKKIFYCKPAGQRTFKGLKAIHGKSAVTVEIDQPDNETALYILITDEVESCGMDEKRIKTAFANAFDVAMERLPESSKTKDLKKKSLPCCSYLDVLNFDGCIKCNLGCISITIDDQEEFGKAFLQAMNQGLSDLSYNCYFLYHEFNKKMPLQREKTSGLVGWGKKSYNAQFADEIVVKFRREGWYPGKCVLWAKEGFLTNLEYLKGKRTYFQTMFTTGYAGMEIDQTQALNYGQQLRTGDLHYASISFNLDPFRECPLKEECLSAWNNPSVLETLTPHNAFASISRLKEVQKKISTLERCCEWLVERNQSGVNVEVIVCLPRKQCEEREELVWTKMYSYFYNILYKTTFGESSICSEFSSFRQQMESTLVPALNTLKGIVQRSIDQYHQYKHHKIRTPDELRTAIVCEAIISFWLHGRLNKYEDGKRYGIRIIRQLNMNRSIRQMKNMAALEPFQGLNCCAPFVSTHVDDDGKPGLVVSETFQLLNREPAWDDLKKIITGGEVEDLREALRRFGVDGENGNYHFLVSPVVGTKLCANILALLTNYSAQALFECVDGFSKCPPLVMNLVKETLRTRLDIEVKFWTAMDFIEDLFENSHLYEQPGLDYVIQELRIQMRSNRCRKMKAQLARKLEVEILTSSSLAFLYPVHYEKWCVILPLTGNENEWFCRSSRYSYYGTDGLKEKQAGILDWYSYAYAMTYADKFINQKLLSQTLTLYSVECMQAEEIPCMHDVMFALGIISISTSCNLKV